MKVKMTGIQATALFLSVILLFGSCASTTIIRSEPGSARVYLNGEAVGSTPYSYTDTKIMGSRTAVRLEKEGYKTFNTTLVRNEEANVGAIIGAILVLIPALWIMEYKPVHTYELEPTSGAAQSDGPVHDTDESNNGALTSSQIQKLRELKKLQEDGIISDAEFEKQKALIMDSN